VIDLRPARLEDIEGIFAIYNHAVQNSVATFDTEPKTEEHQKRWFEEHGERYPILVATDGNRVVGWSALSQWSDKQAYADSAEISLYVREGWRNRGIGIRLTKAVMELGKERGIHVALARVADSNPASFRILESLDFELIGVMREVGMKFGKRLDVTLMQKILA
jgi:phosphinothricin acetyltransferase